MSLHTRSLKPRRIFVGILLLMALISNAQALQYPLLESLQIEDTCGTAYADKLAACTPFRCQQPNPLTMIGFPTEQELAGIPAAAREELLTSMARAEKRLQQMSSEKRAAMKSKMTSYLEIKGPDADGNCQTVTQVVPGQVMQCGFDKPTLKRIAEYSRLVAGAGQIEVESQTHFENGQAVTTQVDTIDGKRVDNPWTEALNSGQCKMVDGASQKTPSSRTPKHNVVATADDNERPSRASSAQPPANTLFILDASGSMWGKINDRPKISIAKQVMARLVHELPDSNPVGLIAYGHRRKGDCQDVQTLVPLGTDRKQSVLDAVQALNAKGKTPLTQSVNQAIDMLRSREDASTVVLISDGIESCGGDPCAAVKAAKASGVNFILHTVGFGLSKQDSAQLECMAKAGDGEYFQANSADELLNSTRKALKSKGPGRFKLTLRSNGKPVKAWVRLSSDSAGLVELTNDAGVEPGHQWPLQPGTYQLETMPAGLQGVGPMVVKGIQVESGKTLEKQLDFEQATLRITATNNGKPAVVQINVINLETRQSVFDTASFSTFTMNGVKTPYEIKLTPGRYRLELRLPTQSDLAPYSEEIDLSDAGKTLNKRIDLETVILRISATQDGVPAKARIFVDDLDAKRNIFNSDFLITGGFKTPYDVILTPGRYRLSVSPEQDVANPWREELDIPSGSKLVEKQIRFDEKPKPKRSAAMELDTDRPGGGDYRHIELATADPNLCRQTCQREAQCQAWTYVKPNTVQGPQANCWLKTAVPPAVPNSCCISGVKQE